jgi:hypothetical protein
MRSQGFVTVDYPLDDHPLQPVRSPVSSLSRRVQLSIGNRRLQPTTAPLAPAGPHWRSIQPAPELQAAATTTRPLRLLTIPLNRATNFPRTYHAAVLNHPLDPIAARTAELMRQLGTEHLGRPLQDLGWVFRFDRAKRRLGLCVWEDREQRKIISLSRHIAAREGWGIMEDVARHEIAHAIDFETRGRSGHDRTWKLWARRCGADPTRLYEGELVDDPTSPYVGRCLSRGCGHTRPFYREVAALYVCPTCRKRGQRSFLQIEERQSGRVLRAGGESPGVAPLARPPKYLARCPSCGASRGFARRPKRRYACGACCRRHAGGRFDPRFELALHRGR